MADLTPPTQLRTLRAGAVVAVVSGGPWTGLAWDGGSGVVCGESGAVLAGREDLRWVWWHAPPDATGARACWDLGAVGALAYGLRRTDPAAVWAAAHELVVSDPRRGGPDLFDLPSDGPLDASGGLDRGWADGGWASSAAGVRRWAELALVLHGRQAAAVARLADPRASPAGTPLAVLTAYAESAAALLASELTAGGLPFDTAVATDLLGTAIGPRPLSATDDAAARAVRDDRVRATLPPGTEVDLRSPDQVRGLLARLGISVPDTRSWRLEPFAGASPAVAALLAWRKADRLATTYGWRWLDTAVTAGRLRGEWAVADGGAGRMTAGSGLHNMPAELRPAVRAEPGHLLVGADLGQVEPRVLAVVSGDPALARAAADDDMYAPVAAQLGCDRPTAKVAVLAAMYGQTSGAAGAALRDMERVYGRAMGFLRGAEAVGRGGGELRTYGGRLLRFAPAADEPAATTQGRGRYARNAMVQGAAAELFKAWAATVRAGLAPLRGEIVLCLHDELLLQVPADLAPQAASLLTETLAQTTRWWAAGSGVRFVADVRTGASWPEVH